MGAGRWGELLWAGSLAAGLAGPAQGACVADAVDGLSAVRLARDARDSVVEAFAAHDRVLDRWAGAWQATGAPLGVQAGADLFVGTRLVSGLTVCGDAGAHEAGASQFAVGTVAGWRDHRQGFEVQLMYLRLQVGIDHTVLPRARLAEVPAGTEPARAGVSAVSHLVGTRLRWSDRAELTLAWVSSQSAQTRASGEGQGGGGVVLPPLDLDGARLMVGAGVPWARVGADVLLNLETGAAEQLRLRTTEGGVPVGGEAWALSGGVDWRGPEAELHGRVGFALWDRVVGGLDVTAAEVPLRWAWLGLAYGGERFLALGGPASGPGVEPGVETGAEPGVGAGEGARRLPWGGWYRVQAAATTFDSPFLPQNRGRTWGGYGQVSGGGGLAFLNADLEVLGGVNRPELLEALPALVDRPEFVVRFVLRAGF